MTDLSALIDWVNTESPTHHIAGVNAMMDLVAAEARGAGIDVERIAGRDGMGDMVVLRAGPRNNERDVLVMSHLDTVHPVGSKDVDLAVRVEGDRLYGPGVYDMKGGAWLAFQAFKEAAKSDLVRRPMTFLFTPDEEIGSPTSRQMIEDLSRQADFVLVTEPARDNGCVVTGRKGVGRFEVNIEGRPAHSGGRHQDGRSAIREAAHQILAIEGLTDYSRGVTTCCGVMKGGTAANVIPHKAWFSVDLRVVSVADGEVFEKHILGLKSHDPDVRVTITGGMNRPPMERTAAVASLYRHARELAGVIGFDLPEQPLTGGGSDGNFSAALGVPTLDGLGVDGDGAHTLQEYALISSIEPRRKLMARLLETL